MKGLERLASYGVVVGASRPSVAREEWKRGNMEGG